MCWYIYVYEDDGMKSAVKWNNDRNESETSKKKNTVSQGVRALKNNVNVQQQASHRVSRYTKKRE